MEDSVSIAFDFNDCIATALIDDAIPVTFETPCGVNGDVLKRSVTGCIRRINTVPENVQRVHDALRPADICVLLEVTKYIFSATLDTVIVTFRYWKRAVSDASCFLLLDGYAKNLNHLLRVSNIQLIKRRNEKDFEAKSLLNGRLKDGA